MSDKIKKIDKEYVLSDSSVNCYGFRLLTTGYQLDYYSKNPIGYYMHNRVDGVVLRWEDLTIKGDKIVGKPVINLSAMRGQQTADEVENGFLNAASVGDIVVLESTTDSSMMLPGQTGPTITKWYNMECSLVDVPGNKNALTKLFDSNKNPISLMSFVATGSNSIVPSLSNEDVKKDAFPPSLFYTKKKLFEEGVADEVKKNDYTTYAALIKWHYKNDPPSSKKNII